MTDDREQTQTIAGHDQLASPASAIDSDVAAAVSSEKKRRPLDRPYALGFALTLGGLVAIAAGTAVTKSSTVLIYVGFALFVALGLDPVVRALERRKLKRPWGIVAVYAGFAAFVAGVLLLVIPAVANQVAQLIKDLPQMGAEFQKSAMYGWVHNTVGTEASTLLNDVTTFLTQPAHIAAIGKGVLQVGFDIVSTISGVIIVLVLSLYFLASLPAIQAGFTRLSPAYARRQVASMTGQITESVGSYLMGMVVLAFCNSVVAFILHLALGLPFPALMAVVAFGLTLIPLVGSVLYWGVAIVVALFTGWLPALLFAAIYLVYMQIEAYVLTPKVMSRAIAVPGALVVIGALVGGTLLGLLGALIAIPVTASILLIIKQVVIPKQDAKLSP
ncbi:putative PurR-regulated permease PerM [Leucobacter exalbidus]|uniref:PurR-regulated permease PerM n=1 Tax=Leucobacter exalbidus TaxID=662960 RepID=A0A940PQU2_9MICO|nr:AI-2E family transporter [Leucobacter exalbidus]MBP1325894.1 putative PurR-regulated permease PerM [Leucobacter exalbidus]